MRKAASRIHSSGEERAQLWRPLQPPPPENVFFKEPCVRDADESAEARAERKQLKSFSGLGGASSGGGRGGGKGASGAGTWRRPRRRRGTGEGLVAGLVARQAQEGLVVGLVASLVAHPEQ